MLSPEAAIESIHLIRIACAIRGICEYLDKPRRRSRNKHIHVLMCMALAGLRCQIPILISEPLEPGKVIAMSSVLAEFQAAFESFWLESGPQLHPKFGWIMSIEEISKETIERMQLAIDDLLQAIREARERQ